MTSLAPPPSNAPTLTTPEVESTVPVTGPAEEEEEGPARWKALESNPDILNELVHSIGVPEEFAFHEVYGLDPDLLAMVPPETLALIVLYPPATVAAANAAERIITTAEGDKKATEATATATPAAAAATPATPATAEVKSDGKEPFYMIQVAALSNACGTVAALHAMANLSISGRVPLAADSILSRWLAAARPLSPAARGESLDANTEIEQAHSKLAAEGQSAALSDEQEEQVELHFACLTTHNGRLIELDGVKGAPVDHGAISTSGTAAEQGRAFMTAAVDTIRKQILAKLGGDVRMSVIAFCAASAED